MTWINNALFVVSSKGTMVSIIGLGNSHSLNSTEDTQTYTFQDISQTKLPNLSSIQLLMWLSEGNTCLVLCCLFVLYVLSGYLSFISIISLERSLQNLSRLLLNNTNAISLYKYDQYHVLLCILMYLFISFLFLFLFRSALSHGPLCP